MKTLRFRPDFPFYFGQTLQKSPTYCGGLDLSPTFFFLSHLFVFGIVLENLKNI